MKTPYKILLVSALLIAISSTVVQAEENATLTPVPSVTGKFKTVRQEIRTERKTEREDIKEDKKTLRTDTKNLKDLVARIVNGTVTANNGTSLTVSNGTTSYTVNTASNTKLRRHFWGSSSLTEIAVNDKVNVWGMFTDTTKTMINATLIRDLSIMKRKGVFLGSITVINGNTITVQTINRGVQTVTVNGSTKYINRKEQVLALSDLVVGHKIRVNGMWDKTNSTITEVKEVKDFTLPVVQTVSPTPTP